jgi:PBP1b-binding outer membrane lipoprotein LpoB
MVYFPMFIFKNLRPVISLILLTLLVAGCGGLQEVWEGPGARIFRPQAIAVLPPMASQYDSAREDIQQVLSDEINKTSGIERVVSPENVTDIFQASKEAFDALVFYFSRLEMTGQSDKDSAVKLGKALNVDSFLVVRVNSWEYMRKEGDNVGRVGLSLRLIDATTGTTVWKARHERSSSYMFYRPNLKDVAKDLATEMIKAMPPQVKQ